MTQRESSVERSIREYARDHGWLVYKFTSPGTRGVPDRLFIRRGVVVFIEVKRPGEEARPLQLHTHKKMRRYGALVWVVDNLEDAKRILN